MKSRGKNILGGEIAERKIPSVKMFKSNTNGHNHPSISFIREQDTNGETNENNKWQSAQEPRTPQNSPTDCDWLQLHQYWTKLPVYICIYIHIL